VAAQKFSCKVYDALKRELISRRLGWLGGVTVRSSDLQSSGRGSDSRPGRYRANYSVFHPSGVRKSSTGPGWLGLWRVRSLVSGSR